MSYRFGSRKLGFNVKKPVQLDKEYEAEIEGISRRGDGIEKSKASSYLCQTLKKEST
jgi:predicted RNA-binding protein with TRAM domain